MGWQCIAACWGNSPRSRNWLRRPGHVLCECDPFQVEALSDLVRASLPNAVIEVVCDLAGGPRGIQVRVPPVDAALTPTLSRGERESGFPRTRE